MVLLSLGIFVSDRMEFKNYWDFVFSLGSFERPLLLVEISEGTSFCTYQSILFDKTDIVCAIS